MRIFALAALIICVGFAGVASAQVTEVMVSSDISVDTVWTANNQYNLTTTVNVLPGACLTIEAGTVIASTPTVNGGGSLVVTRGAQIKVCGTKDAPVIMTSKNDTATWTGNVNGIGGDPSTGMWREAANEWGNLTVCGNAYIGSCATGNTAGFGNNSQEMEGLVPAMPGDPNVRYGGTNDDDDSGKISYLSMRYGGRVIGLGDELNGLSLGGIGRETDMHHVEIMNNVDDGIEIWGGTLSFKYFSIWNIGDDSLDIDQGWRGRAQFGLIVQGWSLNASQGSGVGDNACEHDGAEFSDHQPRTRGTLYNLTVIGQPIDGDGLTAWRDGCGMQYRQCIFMNSGDSVVRDDGADGDPCGTGYGFNGTLGFYALWATPFSTAPAVNAGGVPVGAYGAQTSGFVCEISDSVLWGNGNSGLITDPEYANFVTAGADAPGFNNVVEPATMPIQGITRGAPVVRGGKNLLQVLELDPCPAGAALASVSTPNFVDGFWCITTYRGAFAPNRNWLCGWAASWAFGFVDGDLVPTQIGQADRPVACLDINGCATTKKCGRVGDGVNGPFYATGRLGETLCFKFGSNPLTTFALIYSPNLQPQIATFGPNGQLDIGTLPLVGGIPGNISVLIDGASLTPSFIDLTANTGLTGTVELKFPTPFIPGNLGNFQAFFNVTSPIGGALSNAVNLWVQ